VSVGGAICIFLGMLFGRGLPNQHRFLCV